MNRAKILKIAVSTFLLGALPASAALPGASASSVQSPTDPSLLDAALAAEEAEYDAVSNACGDKIINYIQQEQKKGLEVKWYTRDSNNVEHALSEEQGIKQALRLCVYNAIKNNGDSTLKYLLPQLR